MRGRASPGMARSGCLGSGECLPCVCITTCLHEAVGTCVLSPHGRASVLFRLESILWFWGFLSPCHLPLMRS